MAFLFWLGIRGARSAVVRPNAFLRRKSAAFSACNAENTRKCNRHGGGAAAGVSRLSFHFPFSKISRISLVMRPDPDSTQTVENAVDLSRFILQNITNISAFNRFPNILTAAATCSRRFGFGVRSRCGWCFRSRLPRSVSSPALSGRRFRTPHII